MTIDKNEFFRQATMRICGDLNIETAMWRCLDYIEQAMPVTGMSLHLFAHDMSTVRTIAQVTHYEDNPLLELVIPMPGEARDMLE